MNKTIYTIGRDPSSDICLYDENNLVSRYHAILKVKKNGTYVIIDQSLNGTYINGVRITQGKEVPVTRKDMVMFANVAELDWTLIPKSNSWAKPALISVSAAIVIAAGVCAAIFIPSWDRPSGNISGGGGAGTTVFYPSNHSSGDAESNDGDRISLKTLRERKRAEEIRLKEEQKKARQDSIRNARTGSSVQEKDIAESETAQTGNIEDKNTVNRPSAESRHESMDTVQNSNINAIY